MNYRIELMKEYQAKSISNWKYPDEYSIYNMDGSEDCINELLNGSYYSVTDSGDELIGYCCFGYSAIVPAGIDYGVYSDSDFIDVGIGMRPDLCGIGLGKSFFAACLEFSESEFGQGKHRLTVASFNHRAIRVYEKAGFSKCSSFERNMDKVSRVFIVMVRGC